MFQKIKKFLVKYKRTIFKGLIIIAVLAVIGVSIFLILRACGFTDVEQYIALRDSLGDSVWLWVIIGTLQVVQVIFIPVSNQLITVPCAIVFNNDLWKVWLTAWLSIWLATQVLYWLGRVGGTKILKWLLNDEEQVEKCKKFLNRSWVFYPIGCLLPIIPDDIITTLCGTAKMNYAFVLVSSLITRAIDTACSVFGFGFALKHRWLLIIMGVVYVAMVVVSIWYFKKMSIKSKK